ncbi:MAG: TIGR01777 family oxidoreductase [Planctomycetota bacterium]|jgi:uncharacterized protein (TIGR01777 family)
MNVLISGASGLIGSALAQRLSEEGHEITRLVRSPAETEDREIWWDPAAGRLDTSTLDGFDGVVHLAGENIAKGRWTKAKRRRIRDSRVEGTRLLADGLAQLPRPPKVLVSASAIGFYGDRGDEEVDEESPAGSGFLADVCRAWEAATERAVEAGIRVVTMRIGMVMSPDGGALARMLPLFRLGLGGPIGRGRQYVSWITRDDLLHVVHHVLTVESLQGPVNAVAPEPVTNRRFARALGRALRRPAILPAPGLALRLLLGKMAKELLLWSTRVVPRRLLESGFVFRDGVLEQAIGRLLHRD